MNEPRGKNSRLFKKPTAALDVQNGRQTNSQYILYILCMIEVDYDKKSHLQYLFGECSIYRAHSSWLLYSSSLLLSTGV